MPLGFAYGPKIPDPIVTSDEVHEQIHAGNVYDAAHKDTGLLPNTPHDFLIIIGAVEVDIEKFDVASGAGDVDIRVYEGAIVSANGNLIPLHNRNRGSAKTSTIEVYDLPTVTDVGTEIFSTWIPPVPRGSGQTAGGVIAAGSGKWVLKTNTNYIMRLVNNGGHIIDIYQKLSFLEAA